MRTVGLKVLKNKLSEYVRIVASGETVLVTDRDRVVAEIVPPRAYRDAFASNAVMAELVREGLITPAIFPPGDAPPRHPSIPHDVLMEELERDREDR